MYMYVINVEVYCFERGSIDDKVTSLVMYMIVCLNINYISFNYSITGFPPRNPTIQFSISTLVG